MSVDGAPAKPFCPPVTLVMPTNAASLQVFLPGTLGDTSNSVTGPAAVPVGFVQSVPACSWFATFGRSH
ncbi:MAG: hypothetical protein ACYDAY_07710 [Candidatus Dormibacteria bacterium]